MTKIKLTCIVLVGIYIIYLGGYFFIFVVPETIREFPAYINNAELSAAKKIVGGFFSAAMVIALTGYLLSGIFIVLRKNWARIISIYAGVFIFVKLLYVGYEFNEPNLSFSIFYLIVFGLPILFLAHPKIKVCFK